MAEPSGTIQSATAGGVSGSHDVSPELPMRVAPATADERNTFRSAIFPIACFKVEDIRFEFGSSVVLPEVKREMPALARLIDSHTKPKPGPDQPRDPAGAKVPRASIFGHADPTGNDEFNKALSGRRAAAIYGMLTRRVEVWEDLYDSKGKFASAAAGDTWGLRAVRIMLNAMPPESLAPPTSNSANAGPLKTDGQMGPATKEAVRRFQAGPLGQAAGLGVDGNPGPQTRKALYLAYMDVLCVDEAGVPFKVDPKNGFLARNQDPDGKGDFQGCSEFNPVLLFSQADKQKFDSAKDKRERNDANAPNRRVMVLLFRPDVQITTDFWPCPKAKEGTGGCRERFWSDGEKRRSNTANQREFNDKEDTFACRFYQRLLTASPCETVLAIVRIRLFDRQARPLPFAPCVVTVKGKSPQPDRASGTKPPPPPPTPGSPAPAQGGGGQGSEEPEIDKLDAFITLRDLKVPTVVNVKWSPAAPGDGPGSPPPKLTDKFQFEMNVTVDIPDAEAEKASMTRLQNLGYVKSPIQPEPIRSFQLDHKPRFTDIEVDGTLNEATRKAIKEVHDACDPEMKLRPSTGGDAA